MIPLKKLYNFLILLIFILPFLFSCLLIYSTETDQGTTTSSTIKNSSSSTTSTTYINHNDNFEPDNDINNAVNLLFGDTNIQTHTLSDENDIDFFKFDLVAERKYQISLTEFKYFEPDITLYDTDKQKEIENKNTGTYSNIYDFWGYDKNRNFDPLEKYSIVFIPKVNGTYYFSVKDLYQAHKKGAYYKIRIKEYITINKITNLTAEADSVYKQINLTWTKIQNATGYHLYRTESQIELNNPDYNLFTKIATLSNISYYEDTNIVPNKDYYYYVIGYYNDVTGDPGNIAKASYVLNIAKPIINAVPNSSKFQIDISWNSLNNVNGYNIYRSIDQINYTKISSVTSSNYSDKNIEPNKTYYYYVKGYYSDINGTLIEGEQSNIDDANYSVILPKTNITANPNKTKFQIDLNWDIIEGATSYYVYRSENSSDPGILLSIRNLNNYVDTTIEPDKKYYYYVYGSKTVGPYTVNSEKSNIAEAIFSWSTFKPESALINASEAEVDKIIITLVKIYNNTNVVRYDVYRSPDDKGSSYTKIGSFNSSSQAGSTIVDTNVVKDTYYYYCVKVIVKINNIETESSYSYFDSGVAQ